MYHLDLKERYEYDAYGNCYVLEPNFAPDPDNKTDYVNPYQFTGRSLDVLDGGLLKIMQYRHRYYDTYTGRFFTHDPMGITPDVPVHGSNMLSDSLSVSRQENGSLNRDTWMHSMQYASYKATRQYASGINLYEYVKSAPSKGTDPLGLMWPPGVDPRDLVRSYLEYDLAKACDKFTCEQCCEVGVVYTEEDKAECRREAKEFAREYERGIREYWRIGRDYTWCYEYQQYIMGEDSLYPLDFATRWEYFTLAKGNIVTLGYWHLNFVGVFHVCSRREVAGPARHVRWELPEKSDASLDPWELGWAWWPYPYNRGLGKPYVLEGRKSDWPWQWAGPK
jgi:RHS repeat-associated protein